MALGPRHATNFEPLLRRVRLDDNTTMTSLEVRTEMDLLLSRYLTTAHVECVAIGLQVVLTTFAFSFLIAVVLS